MGIATSTETIAMPDGGAMDAYVVVPEIGHGPGMLVLMEIFGVGDYIREATERLAKLGYVALAPDLYRRIRPRAEFGEGEEALQEAFETSQQLDHEGAVADAIVALEALRARADVDSGSGVIGFCLGGSLAYGVACAADPDVLVAYYGSTIPDRLKEADRIGCPALFHWGGQDRFIPRERAEQVCAVAAARDGWECHIHPDGGHAFDNWDNPMFHQPEPAARAWEQTRAFLARALPVTTAGRG
ncbi:MAG TPA: dienelactone hydrolase family protein [Solirubrobacteraceae bacterium]|nr:dienelactone hydrolase family protein [Solirubrobacteraceae bacterium]